MAHSFIDYPASGPDQGIVKDLTPAAASGTPAQAVHGSLKRLYDKTQNIATNLDELQQDFDSFTSSTFITSEGGTVRSLIVGTDNIVAAALNEDGSAEFYGVVNATEFSGGGTGLTGITASQVGTYTTSQIDAAIAAAIGTLHLNVTHVDRTDSTYDFYGGTTGNGAWKINRWNRAASTRTSATISNNSGVTTLVSAWAARSTSLVFG